MNNLKIIFLFMFMGLITACSGGGGDNEPTVNDYSINVTVSGLAGTGLVLQNNGGDILSISVDGGVSFATALADTSTYAVIVNTQPSAPDQICSVTNGSGIVSGADVTGISVNCLNVYTIGGTVTGLNGIGLVLQNNGVDDLVVSTDGTFSFATTLFDANTYAVTVNIQPTSPNQTCTVTNGSGAVSGTDIIDISVDCLNLYTLGGTVTGLEASGLVLTNNGADDLAINSDGSFSFVTPVLDGSSYDINISSRPTSPRHGCHIAHNKGIASSDVTNVAVTCINLVGKFVNPVATHTYETSYAVDTGDIDGDGDLDYVIGNYQQPNTIWLNDGLGGFVDSGQLLGNNNTYAVALADLDGDGDLDLIEGNHLSQGNTIMFNDGAGNFTDSGQLLGSNSTTSVAIGDVDGDGDKDIIEGTNSNVIWLNNGAGVFTDSGQLFTSSSTYSVVLGDIDNDNDLDLIEGNYSEANTVWLNNGAGIFSDSGQVLGAAQTLSLLLDDLDNDGDLDMFEGNRLSTSAVWMNDGSGVFTDSGQALGSNDGVYGADIADVDGDGDADVVTGNYGISGNTNKLWINDGTGILTYSGWEIGNNLTRAISLGDFDGDGDQDLVSANNIQPNKVWINNESGRFTDISQALGSSNTRSIAVGDINGDGHLDIAAGNNNQANTIWFNNGFGFLSDSGQALGASRTVSIALGDVSKDGDIDLIEGNFGETNNIWVNDGTGTLTVSAFIEPSPGATQCMSLHETGDFLMLFEGNETQGNRVWYNESPWIGFDLTNIMEDAFSSPKSIASGDFDGDGVIDFVEGRYDDVAYVWLFNFDTYKYTVSDVIPITGAVVVTGDIDGDGDLDLIVGVSAWLNNGSGSFTDSGQVLTGSGGGIPLLGDIDGDGDLDLVSGKVVWINNGTGTFANTGQTFGITSSNSSSALGDIDGDGDLDLIEGNDYGEPNRVYINLSK